MWNDVTIIADPESICQTCQITKSRASARGSGPLEYPTTPGTMLCMDIVTNPFIVGLKKSNHFPYYLLIVDGYSHHPFLFGMTNLTSDDVFELLLAFQAAFRPNINQDMDPTFIAPLSLKHIRSDAGSQFKSDVFEKRCRAYGGLTS